MDRPFPPDLRIRRGAIIATRLYDVAYAIDLAAVERMASAFATTSRIQLARTSPKAVSFGVPPADLALGTLDVPLPDGDVPAELRARIYEFGAISLAARLPVADLAWREYAARVTAFDTTLRERADLWQAVLHRITAAIAPALERPNAAGLEEDYLVSLVQQTTPAVTGTELLQAGDVASLIARDSRPLSDAARAELLRHRFTYFTDDLVVLTWDHAFILEPNEYEDDIIDVLEVANAQLLEMRYYDETLDAELPRMYERVAAARQGWRGLGRRRYAQLARDIYRQVAEVTEIAERVDNALIVTEDTYLARIFGAAIEIFRVRTWNGAVERKLAIMRDTYTALYDDAATARAELLELAIVLLIVFEIVMALW